MLLFLISCTSDNKKNSENIIIKEARLREVPGGSDITAGYMRIENNTKFDDRLIKVSCDFTQDVQIHQTYIDDREISRMKMVNTLDISSGKILELKPGGYHLMLMGVDKNFNDMNEVVCELIFEKHEKITVEAIITGF